MPESVTDRPTKAHEYVFLMTKSARYYYDADAVREEYTKPLDRWGGDVLDKVNMQEGTQGNPISLARPRDMRPNKAGRNRRTVWHIATAPYSGAHFATYPPALVEPCIKAGTSERGVCPECGAPWERVVEKNSPNDAELWPSGWGNRGFIGEKHKGSHTHDVTESTTLGWRPTCEHDAEPIPAVVFDPFAGSGTTLQVARALGRHGVGLDLSAEYLQLARQRLELDRLDAWQTGAKKDGKPIDDLPMFKEML